MLRRMKGFTRGLTLMAMTAAACSGSAQAAVTERGDGAVELAVGDRQFVLSASVAGRLYAAVRDHLDDPGTLSRAITAIIDDCAECRADAGQVEAIVAFALFYARGRSAAVDTILRAATASDPDLSGEYLLALLPLLPRTVTPGPDAAEEELAQLQATVENPSQISPVQ